MEKVTVGLITAPGVSERLGRDIINPLAEAAGIIIDDTVDWDFDYKTHPLASSSEFISESFDKAESIRRDNGWDMAIAVSDLPSISSGKVVVSEFNGDKKVSLISVPAIGIISTRKKLRNLIIHHVEQHYDDDPPGGKGAIKSNFMNRISVVDPGEDEASNNRYILKSTIAGWLKLVGGMTYLNEPWTAVSNLKTIVALSFATGTYISIFSTPWELSLDYSLWRFLLLTFIAIFGMTGWLIYAHNLWEKVSTKNQPSYRYLYNFTTVATLLGITIVNYLIVYMLLTVSIIIFVPMGLFETWTEIDPDIKWMDYLNLIWFSSSAGVLAGALGSSVEDEEKIHNVTYSYRQMYRYRQIEEENEKISKARQSEEYAGQEQTHDESEDD
ncbi:hypothetical protein [Salinicoccus carnicancri]|uniref:hypothetical protein n=1 Tax=Salinicoccus carnicancri TaxID=558170 RepID=UPI0002D64419|nr:hypothetical protein [Salinicoccus carnicancri]